MKPMSIDWAGNIVSYRDSKHDLRNPPYPLGYVCHRACLILVRAFQYSINKKWISADCCPLGSGVVPTGFSKRSVHSRDRSFMISEGNNLFPFHQPRVDMQIRASRVGFSGSFPLFVLAISLSSSSRPCVIRWGCEAGILRTQPA